MSGTISSEHPTSPGIYSQLSLYKDKPSCDRLLKDMNNVEKLFRYTSGKLAGHSMDHGPMTYENVRKVSKPAMAATLFWATVLLSCRCVSICVCPYP